MRPSQTIYGRLFVYRVALFIIVLNRFPIIIRSEHANSKLNAFLILSSTKYT